MLYKADFSPDDRRFKTIVERGGDIDADIGVAVARIIASVRKDGADGLLSCIRQFDAPFDSIDSIIVRQDELDSAEQEVPAEFMDAVRQAADNIRRFHSHQLRAGYSHDDGDGVILAKRVLPIARVGVYCPAGTAPLFSSLLMNIIPAAIAGVKEIAVAIPPRKDGSLCPYMRATAKFLGVTEMYKMGGAQAIAALAYGAGPVKRVDKIVGPGNAYVATAKRQVFGAVGIDSVAGPSEIVVIADQTANPRFIAADLLSQVEHGSGYESAVLLTNAAALADAVSSEVETMLSMLERADAVRKALSRYGAAFVCKDLASAADAANAIAPEHLEIVTAEPRVLLEWITNAGAVFLGPWSSEPIGDYFAGTNHVLPTTGAARFSSSLGVADFMKDMSVIEYSRARLAKTGNHIILMAEKEQLTAHANAVRVRMEAIENS
ncbi:MAG: histidinol dehydrogenase [Planctomycetes bacterium]|nr:histidinol dehydrogenase [Planctomycetota bacterium]